MDDLQIIELYWSRSPDAITQTDRKYGNYCRTIAQNILTSHLDAEECVNDTWLKAWNAMPPQKPNHLKAFLGRITRTLAISRYRAEHAQKRIHSELTLVLEELGDCIPSGNTPQQTAEAQDLQESIDRFLRSLSQRDRSIFLRRYWYGEKLEIISRQYGMPLSSVKTALFRSREKLKKHLEKEGIAL